MPLVPMVVQQDARGERSFDIYSAAAARARRLRGRRDQRRDREPRRRAAAAPRGRGPREGHPALRQLARRRRLRGARDLRHDALHQARRGDDLLRDRDVDGLADPGRRRAPASASRCRTRASSSTSRHGGYQGQATDIADPRRGGARRCGGGWRRSTPSTPASRSEEISAALERDRFFTPDQAARVRADRPRRARTATGTATATGAHASSSSSSSSPSSA